MPTRLARPDKLSYGDGSLRDLSMPQHTQRLIVCADDYGFTPGVSRSIRELLAARRISATSVMAASSFWPQEAAALKAVAGDADIGLHVTLTDQTPLGAMPKFAPDGRFPIMMDVYFAGIRRSLPLPEIRAEIERQLASFIQHYGRPPAHIDGHHHVQQLPGVRDIIVDLATRLTPRPWVRVSGDMASTVWRRGVAVQKALIVGALGRRVKSLARKADVPVNAGFSGAYDFSNETRDLATLFWSFLEGTRENSLVMCHPGHSDATLAKLDIMVAARDREHTFFMSDAWPAMLTAHGLDLGPYRRP
jgi:chitin disaccharide deacetylase